jgi:hypothetical protein
VRWRDGGWIRREWRLSGGMGGGVEENGGGMEALGEE